MSRSIKRFLVMLGLAAACAVQAQPARYELDPFHMTLAFMVDHIGYAKVLGTFQKVGGSYVFDEKTGALSDLRVEVETASAFTNLRPRDSHIRGDELLNSGKHPKMVFTATEARRTGDRTFEVAGQLEMLGRTQPLTLQATWNKSAESPLGGLGAKPYVMGVSARGTVKRSAYGMTYGVANGWIGDDVTVIIEFEAIRK